MTALSPVLRGAEGGRLMFWCPGCEQSHVVSVGAGPGPRWTWNGSAEKPTFAPSVLVRGIKHKMDEATQAAYDALPDSQLWAALDDPRFRTVCHTFITDGRIQFLNDCTHALAGQTVDLPAKWSPP